MTNREMRKQTTEKIYKFLKYLYIREEFNFSKVVTVFESKGYNTPVPYQYPLRVVLKELNILYSLSSGNYRWITDKPTLEMAQKVYTACLKSFKKPEVASLLKEAKEIKQAVKELVEDIYLIEPVGGNTVNENLKGLDAVKETAAKTAAGKEMTFILYKKIGTITVTPLTTINYD